jgi:hypothetical protein
MQECLAHFGGGQSAPKHEKPNRCQRILRLISSCIALSERPSERRALPPSPDGASGNVRGTFEPAPAGVQSFFFDP